jgi:Leucine-rich repeat (LRR) protein
MVPETFGKLTALTELGLSGNQISETASCLNSDSTDTEDG